MANARFELRSRGLREYLKGRDYVPGLQVVANSIAERARADAPVDTGNFRESIHTVEHKGPKRHTVQVTADRSGGGAIEKRTRTLGRAAY